MRSWSIQDEEKTNPNRARGVIFYHLQMNRYFSEFPKWKPAPTTHKVSADIVSMGESARLAPSSSFYVVTSAFWAAEVSKLDIIFGQ